MSKFSDFLGTTLNNFRIGVAGVRLKNVSGSLAVRNTGDTADAEITVSRLNNSGDAIVINSDAAGTGADRLYTLQRPAAGMAGNVTLTLPTSAGSPAQALVTDGSGNLSFATIAGGADKTTVDTTVISFGSTSPITMFTLPANAVISAVRVIVDTTFNGTPSLSIGIAGTTAKYVASSSVDLLQPAATVFEIYPGLPANVSAENLIATYASGSATVGTGRIEVDYAIPS